MDRREIPDKLLKLFDNFPGAIATLDLHLKSKEVSFSFVSRTTHPAFGLSTEEIENNPNFILSLVGKVQYENFVAALTESHEKKSQFSLDFYIVHPTKCGKIWLNAKGTPDLQDEDKGIIHFNVFIMDITEQRHLSKKLEWETERLKRLTDNIPGVVYEFEMLPNGESYMKFVSAQAASIAGVEIDEILYSQSFLESSILDEDASGFAKAVEKSAIELSQFSEEFRVKKMDNGETRWIRAVSSPVKNEETGAITWYGFYADITEEKIQEQEREEERMKIFNSSKMATLGEMVGGIAHEINNPLSIIYGQAGLVRRMIEKGNLDKEKVRERLETIEKTSSRIAQIVKSLRAISRNEDNPEFHKQSFNRVVEEALTLSKEKMKSCGIDLLFTPLEEDCMIECSAVQICQVLLNLLGNAKDAVEKVEGPRVELCMSLHKGSIIVDQVRQGNIDYAQVCVCDNGTGISKENFSKLFQPFFTTKEVGRGTGLGLSISKSIADAHKAELSAERVGGKTKFYFKIPCC